MASLAVLLTGCVAPGSSPVASEAPPPAPSPVAGASPSAASTPTAAPTQAPFPTPPVALDETIVARIYVYPDVYVEPIRPMLSVYADGRVLSWSRSAEGSSHRPLVLRWLSPAGLAELRSAFEATGLLEGDIEIPPTTEVNSGYTTYVVSLRREDRLVTARTTNFAMSDEGRTLVELAERWIRPEEALAPHAWLPGWSGGLPYQGSQWSLALSLDPGCCTWEANPDSTELERILGDLTAFGDVVRTEDWGEIRCAVVDAATIDEIAAFLRNQGLDVEPDDGELRADLNWTGTTGRVGLGAFVMLPDDRSCPSSIAG